MNIYDLLKMKVHISEESMREAGFYKEISDEASCDNCPILISARLIKTENGRYGTLHTGSKSEDGYCNVVLRAFKDDKPLRVIPTEVHVKCMDGYWRCKEDKGLQHLLEFMMVKRCHS